MTATIDTAMTHERHALRNAALLAAEHDRKEATYEAEVEYAEIVAKLRECYYHDLAEANRVRLARVTPAHRAYNRAVVAAERAN